MNTNYIGSLQPIAWLRFLCLMCLLCLLCLFCQCALSNVYASQTDFAFTQPQFDNIGDVESIPEGAVTALAQDARGLIWIGTQKGVIRYDGYRFRRFSHQLQVPHSLSGDYVQALWADQDGRVWVGTNSDGISVFDPATEHFSHIQHDAKQPDSLPEGRILAITGDAQGGVWIASDHGLSHLRGSKLRHFRHEPSNPASLLDNKVRSLMLDRDGRLWVGTIRGLQRMRADASGFEQIAGAAHVATSTASNSSANLAIAVQALFQAKDGKIWLGTAKHGAAWLMPEQGAAGLHWLALPTPLSTPLSTPLASASGKASTAGGAAASQLSLSHAWVRGIAQINEQIWLATYSGGVNIVAASDGRVLQHLRHDPALPNSLALDSVKPLLLDQAGLLWIGTWGGGLQRFNPNNAMVRLLKHGANLPHGLSHPNIRSVLELANGQLLLGSNGNGIDILDRQVGLIGGYRPNAGQVGALPEGQITAMAETADGSLWAGTQQSGVLRKLPNSSDWQAIPGLLGSQVRRFFISKNGNLWVATERGIALWQANQANQFTPVLDVAGKVMNIAVLTLAEDAQGNLWAGSDNGLWLIAAGKTRLQRIPRRAGQTSSLISDYITSIVLDQQGRLWFATDKGVERLLRWDGKDAEFEHISAMLGFSGRALGENLLVDRAGRIWSESSMIDLANKQVLELGRADGIEVGSSWLGAYAQTRDGLLIFGGSQGATVIDPARYQDWQFTPPLVVNALQLNGKPAPLGSLLQTNSPHLILQAHQRNFALEFAALDYSDPKKNRYQYRLQGEDSAWIDSDAEHRTAAYGNLWPGRYLLQVRGSNRLGHWSKHELKLVIQVLPAVWQTWWFALLSVLICVGTAYGGYRWRVARLQNLIAKRAAEIASTLTSLANTHAPLELAHTDLASSHQALANAHRHLQETQSQLIQAEKMASLGQLVANVAHEINTPLGAVKSSGSNIADALQLSLRDFPRVLKLLTPKDEELFLALIKQAENCTEMLNSREERRQKRALLEQLGQEGINNSHEKADILLQLHAQHHLQAVLPLLRHADADFILHTANSIAAIINNTHNINLAVGRVSKIVFALKSFARHSSSGSFVPANLAEGLETVLTLYQNQIKNKVELECDFEEIPPVLCLPEELNQVWTNLIHNALQAMQYHGVLSLRIQRCDNQALVTIGDTGCGIAPEIRGRIFDAFFTTKPSGEGSGLGLDIVKKIIAKHHGRIEVESEVGVGTRFLVYLPYLAD